MKISMITVVLLISAAAMSQQPLDQDDARRGVVSGEVVDSSGHVAEHLRVALESVCPDLCQISRSSTFTNQAGKFRFDNVGIGKYAVFADDDSAGYLGYVQELIGDAVDVEITPAAMKADVRLQLPPKDAFLEINLTNRQTRAVIQEVKARFELVDSTPTNFLELVFNRTSCWSVPPNCAIGVPADKPVLVHVSSVGFKEWNESTNGGKLMVLRSGGYQRLNIQLEPSQK